MASYNKFEVFVRDLGLKVHNLNTDTLEVYLSNTTPDLVGDAVKADLAEIATGNGYAGPIDTQNTYTGTGTATLTGISFTITATTGPIGPLRYVVLQNTTPTSPADPLIAMWDYGASITLQIGESLDILFNGAAVASPGTIFTLT
jgi:hypothetical protein